MKQSFKLLIEAVSQRSCDMHEEESVKKDFFTRQICADAQIRGSLAEWRLV